MKTVNVLVVVMIKSWNLLHYSFHMLGSIDFLFSVHQFVQISSIGEHAR